MEERLGRTQLKTGEQVDVLRIACPEAVRRNELIAFYAHKGEPWVWQITQSIDGQMPGLDVSYYAAAIDGKIVGAVAVQKNAWAGLFSHMFVKPEHRRKGLASILIQYLIEHFRSNGGHLMVLSTDPNGTAFQIYSSFGFKPLVPGGGSMAWTDVADFQTECFPKAKLQATPALWRHWPLVGALYAVPGGRYVRHVCHPRFGPSCAEGLFIHIMRSALEKTGQATVLETNRLSVVGLATLLPDARWQNQVKILDVFMHPQFEKNSRKLLAGLDFPPGKVQCYLESEAGPLLAAVRYFGFKKEALLKGQVKRDGTAMDVMVMAKA